MNELLKEARDWISDAEVHHGGMRIQQDVLLRRIDAELARQGAAVVDDLHEGDIPCECGYVWTRWEARQLKSDVPCPLCGARLKNAILNALEAAERKLRLRDAELAKAGV